ncbi:calcium-binding protein [Nocardioides humilatus]|uniref:Calcium-binding protein n=1 Tax=Nocardioides humilatus TaxID=2607660 RepID=A0A5B1LKU1_9ACTN|nr:calcium-binding protein [Nocardioides humilatus]KAA1420237.1 calcium-binding protein [Nocardioides humilatus]
MSAPSIRRSSTKRAAATLSVVTAMFVAPAFLQAASGQPDPGGPPGKGKPGHLAADAPAAPECDINIGDHAEDEFANCADVVLSFESTAGLGVTTTVDVAVTSVKDLSDATLTIGLNDGFALAGADGFSDAGTQASGAGDLSAVSRTIDVTADATSHFSIDVTGVKAGTGIIKATLDANNNAFNGGDELGVALGATAPASPRGYATSKVPASTPKAPREKVTPFKVSGKKPPAQVANGDCAIGSFHYNDENAVSQGSSYIRVQVWDQDPAGDGDDMLTWGYANVNGDYNLCFESSDSNGAGQEVYIRFVTDASAWRIRDTAAGNNTWAWVSGVFNYADPGGTHDFGFLQPSDNAQHRALHAYDGISMLYEWNNGNYLDNPGETRGIVVNWTPTSTDGTYYSTVTKDIHLEAGDPDADHTTIHEGAHAFMDALYDDDWPPVTNCNPHNIFTPSSTTCAWTEGWAEWVPARVLNDPYYRWPDGASLNLETPTWGVFTGAYGDTSEGRIAGALIDLSDSANEGWWDRYTEGGGTAASEEIMATFYAKQVSDTLNEYFNTDRAGEGDQGYLARAALFQNTIDYTHRDPLTSTVELDRPGLNQTPTPHNYSYSAGSVFWGGVAIRPSSAGSDYDLSLYSDEAQATLLTTSAGAAGVIDYVVVDGNHRTGTFFPRAFYFGGTNAAYTIEEFTGGTGLGLGTTNGSFAAGDVIRPFDASVAGGQTNYFRVVPAAGLDVNLYAHDSDGTFAGATQRRSEAIASSFAGGTGVAEQVTYNLADSDWTGIVLTNASGTAGSYTIYRDNAAPSGGSVSVDGGNAQTYDTTVDLALGVTAANTPVTEMQISTDGVFDSEPWVAYSTTGTATLPAGNGTKTVSVRYRSAAGAISTTATDDINLVSVPTCDGLTATVFGNGTVTGTPGNDVIVGGPGPDAIVAQGGNDTICGLGGNDAINDGPGADHVFGDNGNDVITQPAAADNGDVFDGGAGTDQVSYGGRSVALNITIDASANDGATGENDFVQTSVENITTGSGADTIVGSSVANRLIGNGGDDTISGADGNDYLAGVGGADTLRGVNGNDTILAGDGNDTVDEGNAANGTDLIKGGTGFNKITYGARTTAVTIKLNGTAGSGAGGENDRILGFQWAIGGDGGDTIAGHSTADTLQGGNGDDNITGGGGNDIINAGAGTDVMNGNNGQDDLNSVDGVNGNDTVNGGAGTDTATTDPGDIKINIP